MLARWCCRSLEQHGGKPFLVAGHQPALNAGVGGGEAGAAIGDLPVACASVFLDGYWESSP